MKILVADDHALYRKGLGDLLQQLDAGRVDLLHASDWKSALTQMAQYPDSELALVDLYMPGMEPYVGLKALLNQAVTVPVVVVTASESPLDMKRVLDAGAAGYIAKSESADVMLGALRLVLSGGIYVPPKLVQSSPVDVPRVTPLPFGLTPRQFDVLERLLQGKTNKEIAKDLSLTDRTVKSHVGAIFKILGVSNRQQAIKVVENRKLQA